MKLRKALLLMLLPLLVGCNGNTTTNTGGGGGNDNPGPITPTTYDWKYTLDFSKCGFENKETISESKLSITDSITFNFVRKGSSDFKTAYYEPSIRFYAGNSFSLTSANYDLKKIIFSFDTGDYVQNEISVNTGLFNTNTWTGSSKEIVFSIGGTSKARRISKVEVHFNKEEIQPEEEILIDPVATDLGEKTISEVKEYIENHPVEKNSAGIGVDNKTLVTIKGFALAKIDLIKHTKDFGLNVSYPAKVIMADSSGAIGVATNTSNDGSTLWGKINNYVAQPTSKYVITGFISEYLGHPEIVVTSFSWDQNLDINWSSSIISEETISLTQFYEEAANINYNCAGHGYGKVVTINNLTCYYSESDGSGKRYYNFTDGTKSIRVNAFNLPSISEGHVYNVTGIISLKDYSPIIVAFSFTNSQENAANLDYSTVSTDISVANFRQIKGSQEDTNERYPNLIKAFGTFYKTTGYLVMVEESGNLYIGISDSYYDYIFSGKDNAKANGVILIKNSNFWNVSGTELSLFNPYYLDYIGEEITTTLYYVPRQLGYKNGEAMWEVLLIPSSIPETVKE